MRQTVLALILMVMPVAGFSAPEKFTIDPSHTYPYFSISHLGFSTLQGRFNETSGKLTIDTVNKTGSIDIVINAASVDTGHTKRDDHLRSPDFLNATEFPEIVYQSSKVVINDDNSALAEGTLTIMGTAKPVTLNVSKMHCDIHPMDPKKKKYVCGFDATTTIKRSDFGLIYALPAVGDEMVLSFGVEAIRD